MEDVVIVGGGLAGARTAQALREGGYAGTLTLVGAEAHPPYDRPPLSKAVLLGETDDSTLALDWEALDVSLVLGRAVSGLQVEADGGTPRPVVRVDGREGRAADAVVLATGREPVTLPGARDVPGVHVLRTVEQARALRAALRPGARVAVVGAGWVGAEVATAAAHAGCRVTVVEAGEAPLGASLSVEVGRLTLPWYARAGVDVRLGATVADLTPGRLHLADGEAVPFDTAVVGIGVRPTTGWLAGSAVERDGRGSVVVDGHMRTNVPGVLAVGDCVSYPSTRYARRVRAEHWDHALRTPDVAVATLLGHGGEPYDPVPYVWSEQFGHMVQYAGAPTPGTRQVWRGSPDGDAWTLCWLDAEDRLAAVLAVDRPRDLVQARKAATRGQALDPARLADPDVPVRRAVVAGWDT